MFLSASEDIIKPPNNNLDARIKAKRHTYRPIT
jgi:hypothetical protein